MERNKEMFRYAYTQSPYYRSLLDEKGLSIDDLMEDWAKIPVSDKSHMVSSDESVIPYSSCDSSEENQMYYEFSFGSTGLCIEVAWSQKDILSSVASLWDLRSAFYGIQPEDRSCYFYMYPDRDNQDLSPERVNYGPDLGFSMLNLNKDRVKGIYEKMREYQPKWMLLQPSIAIIFATYINESGAEPIASLQYIELTGEQIAVKQKKYIEKAFRCKTVNLYSCCEANAVAYECPEGHLHILDKNVLVEVTKGDFELPEDKEGDILLTSLSNTIMPFVRYKIGDKGKICSKECTCGHPGKILQLTKARKNDLVQVEDGLNVPSYEFAYALQCVAYITGVKIVQCQVEQTSPFSYIVWIVLQDKKLLNQKDVKEDIMRIFQSSIVHNSLRNSIFTFRFRDKLLQNSVSGKLRAFWSYKQDSSV